MKSTLYNMKHSSREAYWKSQFWFYFMYWLNNSSGWVASHHFMFETNTTTFSGQKFTLSSVAPFWIPCLKNFPFPFSISLLEIVIYFSPLLKPSGLVPLTSLLNYEILLLKPPLKLPFLSKTLTYQAQGLAPTRYTMSIKQRQNQLYTTTLIILTPPFHKSHLLTPYPGWCWG